MKIKVLIKEPYKEPEIKEIEDTLGNWQKLVGGYIQSVPSPFDDQVDIICNEDGKYLALDGNFFLPEYNDCICGNVAIVSFNDDGEFASLSDKQIEKAKEYIKNFQLEVGENLYEQQEALSIKAKQKLKQLQDAMA